MELAERKYDLEERLIKFAGQVIFIVDKLPSGIAAKHLAGQLARSRTAPALNYAEAKGAESKRDFVHTMSTILKALRKTKVNLRIIHDQQYLQDTLVQNAGNECNELVLIIAKSTWTARANRPPTKIEKQQYNPYESPPIKIDH
jgi:four helix bundle protein